MMKIFKEEEESSATVVPTFDPTKKYQWTPETTFAMNGQEFAVMLNTLRGLLSTEFAQSIIAAQAASEAMENLLKGAVEDGRAVEIP
jgi:hypothetical protein